VEQKNTSNKACKFDESTPTVRRHSWNQHFTNFQEESQKNGHEKPQMNFAGETNHQIFTQGVFMV